MNGRTINLTALTIPDALDSRNKIINCNIKNDNKK